MHKALYRVWRPKTFDDVIGQNHVTDILKSEILTRKFSHAYLFVGTRGTGKTTCARILAKAVNCSSPENGNPCLKCAVCRGIENETILDVSEIDAASNNSVENIRAICGESAFTACNAKFRVYIIDEVHMLSIGAFNALLKILEEPPSHVIFILATTEAHKVPYTIVSRCQRFRFNRVSIENLVQRIKYICENEKINIENEAAIKLAEMADGSVRDAVSMLDQCSSEREKTVTLRSIEEKFGFVSSENVVNIFQNLLSCNAKNIIIQVQDMYKKSYDLKNLCEQLLNFSVDIMICELTGQSDDKFGEYLEKVQYFSQKLDISKLLEFNDILKSAIFDINKGANKLTSTECALLKICEKLSSQDVLKINDTESENAKNDVAIGENKRKTRSNVKFESENLRCNDLQIENEKLKETPKNITLDSKARSNDSKSDLFAEWKEILAIISKKSKLLYIALLDSVAHETGNNELTIDIKNAMAFEYLKQDNYVKRLNNAIFQITSKNYRIITRSFDTMQEDFQVQDKNKDSKPIYDNLTNELKSKGVQID